MGGYTEIKTWIMGMGSLAQVIEPLKLKEDIINEAKKLLKTYDRQGK